MIDIIINLLLKNSPCRSLQKIESKKFPLSGNCLELGNTKINKKSFFNDFNYTNIKFFFSDIKKLKKKNYFFFNLKKKN